MAEEFETRVPSASMWTVNTLNTDSQANADLFKDLENLSDLPEITTLEELLAYVQENIIRFDTAPKNYKKDDYKSLLKMINRAMFYIYRRDPEITKILNGVYYIGAATTSTDPAADKTARGYNHVGIYTANQAGVYTNFGVTVTENEANQNITFLVPVFDGTIYGTSYTKVVYALPDMATLQGDRLFDKISFNVSNPVPTLLAGQAAWNTDEGTLVVGMNGGDVEQSVGFELYLRIKASVNITNGQLLMQDGTDGNSGVIKAKPAEPGCDPKLIIGIATEDITANNLGIVTWFGKIRGLNTSAFLPNDELFQSTTTSGALQKTMPAAPNNKSKYAVVINSHATVGIIFVRMQRSQSLNDINNVDTTDSQSGQPLVKQSDGVWKGSYSTTINEIQPAGGTLSVPDATINTKTVEATNANIGTVVVDTEITSPGYKVESKTDDDFVMANGGTLPTSTLKAGIYQLHNPSNNTQIVLEINSAGQVLINGDIIQNGAAYKIDAEEVTTKEQQITLRSDATTGMPIGDLAGFIIKLYDGVNDGMIVIDNAGVLRIGDVGDLQPVMTREESPVDQSPLFFNPTTKRAETLPGTTTKSLLVDNDAVMVKDSADSYKPKWWTFANIKANLKSYFDTLFVQLANVNQTIQGVKTFSSLPKIPLTPIANEDAASKQYADGVGNTTMAAANAARDKAQQWAENPEDTEVETGKYSALHWAAKAQNSAETIIESAEMLIKHETEIASLENTINSANINQETTATVTGVDTIALPKTAANTGMQVQLFGQSAQNLVVNGDFRNGTTGWTATDSGAVLSASNNILTHTVAATQFEGIGVRRATTFLANNKYYLSADIKTNNNSSGTLFYGFDSTAAGYVINIAGVNDSFVKLSGILTAPIDRSNVLLGQRSARVGVILQYKNVIAINLTAAFGAGNEPTKEQCDLLFANYFEGSDNVLGTGRVRSVGKNLFDGILEQGSILVDGTLSSSGTAVRTTNFISIEPSKQYTITTTFNNSSNFIRVIAYDINRAFISVILSETSAPNNTGVSFTTPANTKYIKFRYYNATALTISNVLTVQIERNSTATTYEPYRQSILQLTTPELRSNGTTKDEIRKGTNGYELVKRVGVGTLGAELITNAADREFSSDTGWWTKGPGTTINEGGNGLVYIGDNAGGISGISFIFTAGKTYRISLLVLNSNNQRLDIINFSTGISIFENIQADGVKYLYFKPSVNLSIRIYSYGFRGNIDNISFKEVTLNDGTFTGNTFTEIGSNVHYTLATPVITPIPHAGLLNSNSNGTAYFEPIIADAGVYSSNLAIQLTDYPISSFESIRKYANGTYTELNTATAVIASGGLSFTHPDLVSGDLVMFTYAYANESIGRSMTLTYAISNSNPYYNITNSVPLTTGYYTSTTARAAVPEGIRKTGLILTYETAAGVWYTERYIGTATDTTSWTTAGNWEIGVLRIAAVTDTTEYAEITI